MGTANQSLTFGSLFAGIGGMDLGLERAGMECRWQVEINPFCQQVLAKHWPNVKRYGDITKLTGDELEPVDLICGGFPCQDVSQIGLRAGVDDGERSSLYKDMLRIVRRLRPPYALLENVSGLLVDGMGRVLGDLAEIGYDAEWHSVSACAFGAPHMRRRVFIVAHPQSKGLQTGRLRSGITPGYFLRPNESPEHLGPWATQPGVCGVVHGLPKRMDRIKALGNSVVPQVSEWIGRRIISGFQCAQPQ